MYLVKIHSTGFIKECEDFEEVKRILKTAVFEWTLSDNYEGMSHNKLYNSCMKEKNFGSIASVLEFYPYFTVGTGKYGKISCDCNIYSMDRNVEIKIKKIL